MNSCGTAKADQSPRSLPIVQREAMHEPERLLPARLCHSGPCPLARSSPRSTASQLTNLYDACVPPLCSPGLACRIVSNCANATGLCLITIPDRMQCIQ